MEPILEPDDVDLVISSGHWSAEVLTEVAEFFHQCDEENSSTIVSKPNCRESKSTAASEVTLPVVPGT